MNICAQLHTATHAPAAKCLAPWVRGSMAGGGLATRRTAHGYYASNDAQGAHYCKQFRARTQGPARRGVYM